DGVLGPEQGLEQAAIGVEAGREQDGVVLVEELCDRLLQLPVDGLRAADEAHGGHAEAVVLQSAMRRGNDLGIVREAEIVIGAKIDHLARCLARADPYAAALRPVDLPFALVESVRLDAGKDLPEVIAEVAEHGCLRSVWDGTPSANEGGGTRLFVPISLGNRRLCPT